MNAVIPDIQMSLKTALCCAVLLLALLPVDARARSCAAATGMDRSKIAFLSGPRDEAAPSEEIAPRFPTENSTSFDGAWTFTSAGCRYTGSVHARIIGGKIIVKGGSGQVDPDGTLHSVGAGGGMTLTAVGRLSGNTGAGTFDRSDGCLGRWIAIKH
jgi:hypothetical protein